MTPRQFYDLVVRMRKAQRAYKSMSTTRNMIEAQSLERQVDAEIARVEAIDEQQRLQQPQQQRLL